MTWGLIFKKQTRHEKHWNFSVNAIGFGSDLWSLSFHLPVWQFQISVSAYMCERVDLWGLLMFKKCYLLTLKCTDLCSDSVVSIV